MKKKLGCLFIPVVIFVIVGIVSIITILATDNVEDEIFTIADTEEYTLTYYMNTESALLLDGTSKTENPYLVELIDVKSGNEKLEARGNASNETFNQTAIRLEISEQRPSDTEEQYYERNMMLDRYEIIAEMRTDSKLVFTLRPYEGEVKPDLIEESFTGTVVVYTYDAESGEVTEIGRHDFTKEAGIDGQI